MAKVTTQDALRLALEQHKAGNFQAAENLYRKILVHDTNNPDALHLLGVLLRQTGRVRTGIDLLTRAVAASPNIAQFHNHLGQALRDLGRPDEAIDAFRGAINLDPNYAEAHNNLGAALHDVRLLPQSIASFRKAIALGESMPDPHSNLGNVLLDIGRVDEAAAECRLAIQISPGFGEAYNNLGNALCEMGYIDDAIAAYRSAVQVMPQSTVFWSNLLFTLHTDPKFDGRALLAEHRKWAEQARPLTQNIAPHSNDPDPNRRLRIGYVSSDFRDHPVGRFLLPLLAQHDREHFEIHCFADVMSPTATVTGTSDEYTRRLREHADHWHITATLTDAEIADLVRHNRIDILVDLRVHSSPNRLLTFARKPAPVQITYLGYPGTTGLPTLDYRFTDAHLDPPGADSLYTEKSIRLPCSYWSYRPHPLTPAVAALPAQSRNHITFGCLNSFTKISQPVLTLWRELLKRVPDSRLLLHAHPGTHRDRVKLFMEQGQVSGARVDFVGKQSMADYLATYNRIDIALDCFPFAGGTTSCEALYMGCPLITLASPPPAAAVSRMGASILTNAMLPEFIATSEADYLRIAENLAADIPRLAKLRAALRQRLSASPLMDEKNHAGGIEQTYRQLWQQWCARK